MNEQVIREALELILTADYDKDYKELVNLKTARLFRKAMPHTNSEGLVIQMADGTEFQITIVQSK